jgi:transposase
MIARLDTFFHDNGELPFTNNAAEKVIRMTKVYQKISGCICNRKGAEIFCRIRGYLPTCRVISHYLPKIINQ